MPTTRKKSFRRYGRSYHLRIETAADLQNILELDEAHWVATNAPIKTINCDPTFLKLLDTDGNGRITCKEMNDAISWLGDVLQDQSGVAEASSNLRLAAISTDTGPGRNIPTAAEKILSRLGQGENDQITLADVRQIKTQVESMPVSEAGLGR